MCYTGLESIISKNMKFSIPVSSFLMYMQICIQCV